MGIAVSYPQTIGTGTVTPQFYNTVGGGYGAYSTSPNITWQSTSSGATYTAASSVLHST